MCVHVHVQTLCDVVCEGMSVAVVWGDMLAYVCLHEVCVFTYMRVRLWVHSPCYVSTLSGAHVHAYLPVCVGNNFFWVSFAVEYL